MNETRTAYEERNGANGSAALSGALDRQIGVIDLWRALMGRKRLILGVTAAGAALAGALAFLLPKSYSATAVIMPPQQQPSAAAALVGQFAPIAAIAGRDVGVRSLGDLYMGILGSRTVADTLIERFRLRDVYGAASLSEARDVLSKRTRFQAGRDSLIHISVDDRDPRRAARLANAYVEELHQQNSRLAVTESAQRRLFFERRLEAEKKELAAAEAGLKAFQERAGAYQVSAQAGIVIQSIAAVRAQIALAEVSLQRLKAGATDRNPEVIRQETEVAALRNELRRLQALGGNGEGDPMMPTARVPSVGLEYTRLLREVKYHETLLELLAKQYETARIDEAREASVIQVVDEAVPPGRKSWPPRLLFILAGTVLSGTAASLFAAGSEIMRLGD